MLDIRKVDFEKGNGLVPVIAQDVFTSKILMLGYSDKSALEKTIETRKLTFFSRTKNRQWTKGEESGNYLNVQSLSLDCDNDAILAKVSPIGPVCHTGEDTCWSEKNQNSLTFITKLESVIDNRVNDTRNQDSYIAQLFSKGINKIAQKVGEEAIEMVIEAKDQNDDLFIGEAADLFFHYLLLLKAKNFELKDVIAELEKRHKP